MCIIIINYGWVEFDPPWRSAVAPSRISSTCPYFSPSPLPHTLHHTLLQCHQWNESLADPFLLARKPYPAVTLCQTLFPLSQCVQQKQASFVEWSLEIMSLVAFFSGPLSQLFCLPMRCAKLVYSTTIQNFQSFSCLTLSMPNIPNHTMQSKRPEGMANVSLCSRIKSSGVTDKMCIDWCKNPAVLRIIWAIPLVNRAAMIRDYFHRVQCDIVAYGAKIQKVTLKFRN